MTRRHQDCLWKENLQTPSGKEVGIPDMGEGRNENANLGTKAQRNMPL